MPLTLELEAPPVAQGMPPRKKWTRAECESLNDQGLAQGQRYELIEGERVNQVSAMLP